MKFLRSNPVSRHAGVLITASLCIVMSAAAVLPFFFMGEPAPSNNPLAMRVPVTHDLSVHYLQIQSFVAGLEAGSVYPRWAEDANRGFGSPVTNFYPPGVYYLVAFFIYILGDPIAALIPAMLILMIGSALAINLLARRYMSGKAAAITMVAYIFFPYHLLDLYQRGALAELSSFIWMPLILYFLDKLMEPAGTRIQMRAADLAGLALAYGAFLWFHLPTAFVFTIVLVPMAIVLAVVRRNLDGIWMGGIAGILGLMLSAAYLLPAAVEQDFVRKDYFGGIFPYHQSYVFDYSSALFQRPANRFALLIDDIWLLSTVGLVLMSAALFVLTRRRNDLKHLGSAVWIFSGAGVFVSFMMTRLSIPVGRAIPLLDGSAVQFSWRFLSITALVFSLLIGLCVEVAVGDYKMGSWTRFGLLFLALSTLGLSAAFSYERVVGDMRWAPVFEPPAEHINYAIAPPDSPGSPPHWPRVIVDGGGDAEVARWDPELREIYLRSSGPGTVRVRTYDFPGWTARLNGEPVKIERGDSAEITVHVPPGELLLTLVFESTPARKLGSALTLTSLSALMALSVGARLWRSRRQ